MSKRTELLGSTIVLLYSITPSAWSYDTSAWIEELTSEDSKVRIEACAGLRLEGRSDAVPPLLLCLEDSDVRVRVSAVSALHMIALREGLRIGPPVYKADRVTGFISEWGRTECPDMALAQRLREGLEACLKDESSTVRADATLILMKMGVEPATEEDRYGALLRQGDLESFKDIGKPAVPFLLDVLNTWGELGVSPTVAAMALDEIGDPTAAVEPILKLLRMNVADPGSSRNGTRELVICLGRLRDARATGTLIEILKRADYDWLCDDTARALGRLRAKAAIDPLVAAILRPATGTYGQIRDWRDKQKIMLNALAEIGDATTAERVAPLLGNWHLSQAVRFALLRMGWRPSTERERVYYWISMKHYDRFHVEELFTFEERMEEHVNERRIRWEADEEDLSLIERVLLEDAQSGDLTRVENACFAMITYGKEEWIDALVTILQDHGDLSMANTYLNCGNAQLEAAADTWARDHGYKVRTGGQGGEAHWGR